MGPRSGLWCRSEAAILSTAYPAILDIYAGMVKLPAGRDRITYVSEALKCRVTDNRRRELFPTSRVAPQPARLALRTSDSAPTIGHVRSRQKTRLEWPPLDSASGGHHENLLAGPHRLRRRRLARRSPR